MSKPWRLVWKCPSADPDFRVREEFVRRKREIGRCRALPDATGRIVHGAVARAEVAVIGPFLGKRYAAEVRADRDQHLPLVMARLDASRIGLRIGQLGHIHVLCVLDLFFGAVRDEYWLAAPKDLDGLA